MGGTIGGVMGGFRGPPGYRGAVAFGVLRWVGISVENSFRRRGTDAMNVCDLGCSR